MATIVRYGEIGTKSEYVKKMMETYLIRNIKSYLRDNNLKASIRNLHGRIYLDKDIELNKIVGIVSYSFVSECELNIEEMSKVAYSLYKGKKFRITSKRINKNFPMTSQEISMKVGEYIHNKGGKVDLTKFDQEIFVEVIGNKAFIFDFKNEGKGGLPLGTTGKMLALISSEDDEYAALVMMKRGVSIDIVGKSELVKKWAYGYRVRELEEIPPEVFSEYSGIVTGLKLDDSSQLEEFKKLFAEYKYVYTPLVGYNLNELKKEWKE